MASRLIKTYDKIASRFGQANFSTSLWAAEFNIFKNLVRGKRVVDIGCGAGRDAVMFTRSGFDYTGIDASQKMLAEAKKRAEKARFIKMDFYNITLPKKSFDGFWACASILHVPKRRAPRILQSAKKLLKPQRVGFISVKTKRGRSEGIFQEQKYGTTIRRYFSFYTMAEFKNLLEENGFEVVKNYSKKSHNDHWLCFFVRNY